MAKSESVRSSPDGDVYVSASGGVYYTNPKVDAANILDATENSYIREQIDRHIALLFTDEPVIRVVDEAGEPDEELSDSLMRQAANPDVALYASMKRTYRDVYEWGPSIINDVWPRVDGEYQLTALNRLPPQSFATAPTTGGLRIYNEILQGITLGSDGKPELWQTVNSQAPKKVERADLIVEPTATVLGGKSSLIPLLPLVSMLKFSWQSQMQRVNRIGSPLMFIKIIGNPIKNTNRDDIAWAKSILQSWGSRCTHLLRDNMELVTPSIQDSASALEGIKALEQRVAACFNPAQMLKKEGSTIGGNAAAELDMTMLWIKGVHGWIEAAYERILNRYLTYNNYQGYRVEIDLPEPTPDSRDIDIRQAQAGFQTRSLTTNEIRAKLGHEPLEDADLQQLAQDYAAAQPAPQPFGFMQYPGIGNAAAKPDARPDADSEELDKRLQAIEEKTERRIIKALRNEKGSK